ncbi:MAG: hypothetical protein KDD45_11860, partial [Bdellovibrionales bacterium]|nr:hypothetical protein [Bdellovibrionales bacterium]
VSDDYSKKSGDFSVSYSSSYFLTSLIFGSSKRTLFLIPSVVDYLDQPYVNSQNMGVLVDFNFLYPFSLTLMANKIQNNLENFGDYTDQLFTDISFNEYSLISKENYSATIGYSWDLYDFELVYLKSYLFIDNSSIEKYFALFDFKINNHYHLNFDIGQDSTYGLGLSYDWY